MLWIDQLSKAPHCPLLKHWNHFLSQSIASEHTNKQWPTVSINNIHTLKACLNESNSCFGLKKKNRLICIYISAIIHWHYTLLSTAAAFKSEILFTQESSNTIQILSKPSCHHSFLRGYLQNTAQYYSKPLKVTSDAGFCFLMESF